MPRVELPMDAYVWNPDAYLFAPKDSTADLPYSDGDRFESRLLDLMTRAADRSLHSAELAAAIVDWPSLYHLSALRANLLRPLESVLRGRTLEVGAGCGPLTRYLGELGGDVVAIEGNRRRAEIAAARCRGLDNVAVCHDRFERFTGSQPFDAITLVGVLEWASQFGEGPDAATDLLVHAARLLSEKGCLVLAIENQLGLKYFGGWPEDHLGVAMASIDNRYRPRDPRTFGRQALLDLLAAAGFGAAEVFAPFPDYKLPRVVVTPGGLANREHRDAIAGLIANAPTTDPQAPVLPLFSMERALGVVAQNGLLADLANSFLIVARRAPVAVDPDSRLLAVHYGGSRRPRFLRETRLVVGSQGNLDVERRPLYPELATTSAAGGPLRHRPIENRFSRGDLWTNHLEAIVNRPGWTVADVVGWAAPWYAALCRAAGVVSPQANTAVPSMWLDATPFNMAHADGVYSFFDLEWELDQSVEFGYVLVRGVTWSLSRFRSVGEPAHGVPLRVLALARAVCAGNNIKIAS